MKKLISIFLMVIMCTSLFALTYVNDLAKVLDDSTRNILETELKTSKIKHGLDIVILTSDNLEGKSRSEYAHDFYVNNGYGEDGSILLIDNAEGYVFISTMGKLGDLIDSAGRDYILDLVIDADTYSDAFKRYETAIIRYFTGDITTEDVYVASFITDNANLITASQRDEIEQVLEGIHQDYPIDLAIVTTNSTGDKTGQAYADDWYDMHGFRLSGGALLMIDMGNRYAHISTVGSMIQVLNSEAVDVMLDNILDYGASGDWYSAFVTFIKMALAFNQDQDAAFETYGYSTYSSSYEEDEGMGTGGKLAIALAIGLIASLITVLIMKAKLNMVHALTSASSYEVPDSFELTIQKDIFKYKSVSKTAKSSSSSSGGGSHSSSSGVSHGGGGRSF